VVDLGVVDIQFSTGAVVAPGPQQRIGQDVEVLADVVTGLHDVTAVAVNPGRKVRLDSLSLLHHQRSVLEVADPQCAGLLSRPTATDLLRGNTQLAARRSGASQMVIERAPRERASELAFENLIDDFVGAEGLLFFQLHGAGQ